MAYTPVPAPSGGTFTAGSGFDYLTTLANALIIGGSSLPSVEFDTRQAKVSAIAGSNKVSLHPNGLADGVHTTMTNGTVTAYYGMYGAGGGSIGVCGTATNHPFTFRTGNSERARILVGGGVELGVGALATTATAGYPAMVSCAGVPTGVPAGYTAGMMPFIFDSTNNKISVYDGGWLQTAALT